MILDLLFDEFNLFRSLFFLFQSRRKRTPTNENLIVRLAAGISYMFEQSRVHAKAQLGLPFIPTKDFFQLKNFIFLVIAHFQSKYGQQRLTLVGISSNVFIDRAEQRSLVAQWKFIHRAKA